MSSIEAVPGVFKVPDHQGPQIASFAHWTKEFHSQNQQGPISEKQGLCAWAESMSSLALLSHPGCFAHGQN